MPFNNQINPILKSFWPFLQWLMRRTRLFLFWLTSHKILPVSADGLELFEKFARNVQVKSVEISAVPENLKSFFKTIQLSYLIPKEHEGPLLEKLREIYSFGNMQANKKQRKS